MEVLLYNQLNGMMYSYFSFNNLLYFLTGS